MNKYAAYAGWSVQTMVIILLCAALGKMLDDYWQCTLPWCLSSFSFLGTVVCLYILIKRLLYEEKPPTKK